MYINDIKKQLKSFFMGKKNMKSYKYSIKLPDVIKIRSLGVRIEAANEHTVGCCIGMAMYPTMHDAVITKTNYNSYTLTFRSDDMVTPTNDDDSVFAKQLKTFLQTTQVIKDQVN